MNTYPDVESTKRHRAILVVEEDAISSKIVSEVSERHGFETIVCGLSQAVGSWDFMETDVCGMILDTALADGNGIDIIRKVRKAHPNLPCLVLSANDHAHGTVLALKAGASDYLTKPVDPDSLQSFMTGVVELYCREHQVAQAGRRVREGNTFWRSAAMSFAVQRAEQAAGSNSPVLLLGACGTGKSTFSRMIHHHSGRAVGGLLTLDVAALRTDYLVNRLFGRDSEGWGECTGRLAAHASGTVCLENIDRLDSRAQAAMMEWYESEVRRLERGGAWSLVDHIQLRQFGTGDAGRALP